VPDFLECNCCKSQGASAHDYIILEILKAKNIKIMVFEDMTPCSLVQRYQDIHSSGILSNVDWSSTSYGGLWGEGFRTSDPVPNVVVSLCGQHFCHLATWMREAGKSSVPQRQTRTATILFWTFISTSHWMAN